MKIFITGSSGKIGRNLTNFLIENKFSCIINSRRRLKKKTSILYQNDILKKNFKIPNCDAVIHLAAITPEKNKKKIYLNKLIDEKIFLEVKKNKNVKKLIFLSTVAVYNSYNNMKKLSEKSNNFSSSIYSYLKLRSERLFLQNKGIEVYILRVPALLSTGYENNFIGNLIDKIKNNKRIELYNSNQLFNNLLLMETLNGFVLNLLKNKFKSGCIILCTNKSLKLLKITQIVSKYFKVKSNIIWLSDKKRGFHLNMSNAMENYNFKTINTEKSIIKYLKYNYPKNA